jgi:hypothetical protein
VTPELIALAFVVAIPAALVLGALSIGGLVVAMLTQLDDHAASVGHA